MDTRTLTMAAAFALTLAPLTATEAQEPAASLEGIVLDASTMSALPGVLIAAETGQKAKTDEDGHYELWDVPPGSHRVAVVTPTCGVSFVDITFRAGETQRAGFQVPSGETMVGVSETRSGGSGGRFLTAAEIEEMRPASVFDLLRRIEPGMVSGPGGQPGRSSTLRGRVTTPSGPTVPVVVLDGVVLGTLAPEVINDIKPGNLASIEVLRGAAAGWEFGTGGSGGVIKLSTKRGMGAGEMRRDPERCPIPW